MPFKHWILGAAFLAFGGACLAADSVALDRKEAEENLQDLRSPNKADVLETLRYLSDMQGYPESAQVLLPALLWLSDHQDDTEIGEEAEAQAKALGWPEHYCLACIRKFAAREDLIYKMMGLSALTKIAWKDPEAMTILFEVTKDARRDTGVVARAISSNLKHIDCGMQSDMDKWNSAALPFMGRMQSALAGAGWQLRELATILLKCPLLRDDLKRSLKDFLDRVPEPLSHLTPTPVTRVF